MGCACVGEGECTCGWDVRMNDREIEVDFT